MMGTSRRRTLATAVAAAGAAAVLGVSLGAGSTSVALTTAAVAAQPVAAPVPAAAVAAGPVYSSVRGWCTHNGDGDVRDLWLLVGGACQAGYHTATDLPRGPAGPAGPAGAKGDPGDSRIVITSGHLIVTENGTGVVAVPGMPPYSVTQARRVFVDVDGEILATGVTVATGVPVATPGGTVWNFPVTVGGMVVATPDQNVRLDVLAVPVP